MRLAQPGTPGHVACRSTVKIVSTGVRRAAPLFVSAAVLLLVVWPMGGDQDSFPFSNYPMFAGGPTRVEFARAVGLGEHGAIPIEPRFIANAEPMQASAMLRQAASQGGRRARNLCRHIAERVAADPQLRETREVAIDLVTYDPVEYLTKGPRELERKRRARCQVKR
jgi:hypothetical protein